MFYKLMLKFSKDSKLIHFFFIKFLQYLLWAEKSTFRKLILNAQNPEQEEEDIIYSTKPYGRDE
jgi:hypothetical protein